MPPLNDSIEKDECVYEVNIEIDMALRDAFRAWLQTHIEEMLSLPGFEQAFVLEEELPQEHDLYRCTVHYVLANREALQAYFADHAERMRARGIEKFGTALTANRRILSTRAEFFSAAPADRDSDAAPINCLDCGTLLRGQYCYNCGQRDQRKLVSLGELVGDLVHDLVDWDTRLWKTVGPLLTRPGHLTKAYLEGQRMRFSPPLRMYLIASIVFFLVASIGPQLALRKMDVSAPLSADDVQVSFGVQGTDADDSAPPPLTADVAIDGSSPADPPPADRTVEDERRDVEAKCAEARQLTSPVLQGFLRERAYQSCLRLTTREGLRDFALEMLDNLPPMLFFLLPLMALVNKIFYLFSRRFYVEHLLFYVHGYSFIFVFWTIILMLGAVFKQLSLPGFGWIEALALLYVIYYFLRSMRVVYGQSRAVTFAKWLVINVVFFGLAMAALGILALITAAMVT